MIFSLFSRIRLSCLFLFFLFFFFSNNLGAEVSIPSVPGPIEVTSDSYPFCAANRSVVPQDLNKCGYVEEEYFVSGKANVYDFDDTGKVIVVTPDAPYTTRILIRRPRSKHDFSGNVIIEMMNSTILYDVDLMWMFCNEYFINHRDIWIGITIKPIAAKALKKFDTKRYAPISWANPVTPEKRCPVPSDITWDTTDETENGLAWDIMSQVGALARENNRKNPLSGYNVERVYATGYSQSAGYLVTYINFIRPLPYSVLKNGKPIYDGYMVGDGDAVARRLNQCSPAFKYEDPRIIIKSRPEPVISVVSQSLAGLSLNVRREDSDSPDDRYRCYEIAGAPHANDKTVDLFLNPDDIVKAGLQPFENVCIEVKKYELSDFPFEYFLNGAFANLDAWVKSNIIPPRAPRMVVKDKIENEYFGAKLGQYDNAIGGLRTPYLDVPVASYYSGSTGVDDYTNFICGITGYKVPFEKEVIKKLYKTREEFLSKVNKMVDSLVRERFIIKEDGEKIKREAEELKAWMD